ncbi:hypothetical protein HHL21_14475 [Massilia sp. RP-1-19]|uniref:Terminase small subunit n=1 Tax=Massilia polaris TaxID=2728846 RepID=A0A848HQ69_9BURK|nr:hypothetical protein [Massilia polaris]NML62259.1 hypothetical protein [Massilia polaris]
MALMGYREYSRHAGVTLRAVQKAIEAGHIRVTSDKKIESDLADRDWRNSKDVLRPVMSMLPEKAAAPAAPGITGNRANVAAPPRLEDRGDEEEQPEAESDSTTGEYRIHRATREKFSALKQELEYKQLAGELIAVEEAKRIAFTTLRGIRDSVLNVPARLKDQLAALDDPHQCERLLESALSSALAGIDVGKLLQEQDE